VADRADYLDLTVSQARLQFRELMRRSPVSSGRQVTFLPVETLLCLAASFQVNHRHFCAPPPTGHLSRFPPWPTLQDGELAGYEFVEPGEVAERVIPLLARRIAACVDAVVAGTVISLEDGCPAT
jgi:hypothetical protein